MLNKIFHKDSPFVQNIISNAGQTDFIIRPLTHERKESGFRYLIDLGSYYLNILF